MLALPGQGPFAVLSADGANGGGPDYLQDVVAPAFFIGANDPLKPGFTNASFDLFAAWGPTRPRYRSLTPTQQAIGRGEAIFNGAVFVIHDVPGLNGASDDEPLQSGGSPRRAGHQGGMRRLPQQPERREPLDARDGDPARAGSPSTWARAGRYPAGGRPPRRRNAGMSTGPRLRQLRGLAPSHRHDERVRRAVEVRDHRRHLAVCEQEPEHGRYERREARALLAQLRQIIHRPRLCAVGPRALLWDRRDGKSDYFCRPGFADPWPRCSVRGWSQRWISRPVSTSTSRRRRPARSAVPLAVEQRDLLDHLPGRKAPLVPVEPLGDRLLPAGPAVRAGGGEAGGPREETRAPPAFANHGLGIGS